MTEAASGVAADAPQPRSKNLGRVLKLGVLVVVLVAAGVYGNRWWTTGRFQEETDDAYIGADVTVIGSKVPGYIVALPVVDNQFVHAGDLLLRLDDRDYRAALAKAESAVDAQEAALGNLDATTALQQAVIARAAADIGAVDAEVTRAGNDNKRYQDLVSRSSVSVESAQRTEAAFKTAQANATKARAEALGTRRQLDVIAAQRRQAMAALEQAKAERDIAQLNLSYTELRAPVDGFVGNKRGRIGAFATAGSPLLSVVPANGLWVDANFKEDQLARMRPGQRVLIHADVMPDQPLHGHLQSLAPATGAQFSILPAENATGNFTKIVQRVAVRVKLDDADGKLGVLRPGLSVTASVDTLTSGSSPADIDNDAQAQAHTPTQTPAQAQAHTQARADVPTDPQATRHVGVQ